jgi:hypothetical protein
MRLPEFLAALHAATLDEVFIVYDTLRYAEPRPRHPGTDRAPSIESRPGQADLA